MNRMLDDTLPFGKLVDLGMREYGEFACSSATAVWLQAGAMRTVDGRRVSLIQVVDRCENSAGDNVICHVYFEGDTGRSDVRDLAMRGKVAA